MTAPAYNASARFPVRTVPRRLRRPWTPAGLPLRGPDSDCAGFAIDGVYRDDPPVFAAGTGLIQALPDNGYLVAPMSATIPDGVIPDTGDEGAINEAYQLSPKVMLAAGQVFKLKHNVYVPAGAKLYLQAASIDRAKITLGTGACIVDDCTPGGGLGTCALLAMWSDATPQTVNNWFSPGLVSTARQLDPVTAPVGSWWDWDVIGRGYTPAAQPLAIGFGGLPAWGVSTYRQVSATPAEEQFTWSARAKLMKTSGGYQAWLTVNIQDGQYADSGSVIGVSWGAVGAQYLPGPASFTAKWTTQANTAWLTGDASTMTGYAPCP